MFRKFVAGIGLVVLSGSLVFGQDAVTFDAADVHPTPPFLNLNGNLEQMGGGLMHGGLYELRRATMLDLIHTAYGLPDDKIVGGPNWLEMNRFDVVAKGPEDMKSSTAKLMLRSLLAERFHLVIHNDKKTLPGFALTVKKPQLKKSDGSGDSGCKTDVQNGNETNTVPTVTVTCQNMSMGSFADALKNFRAADQYIGDRRVADQTGLEGTWDFSFHYSIRARATKAGTEVVTLFEALEKQLGIVVQPATLPTDVLVVESVNQNPTPNSLEVKTAFPPQPLVFEVATIKPTDPSHTDYKFRVLPGGRIEVRGVSLKPIIADLWGFSEEMVLNAPKFSESDKWDIVAKAPPASAILDATDGQSEPPVDIGTLMEMEKQLLKDRFHLAVHLEERSLPAYTLTSAKPKMRKADPAERTRCTEGPAALSKTDARDANPFRGRLLTCYNASMAQLAARLQILAGGYVHSAILDSTGLDGGYDFTINFSTTEQLLARNAPSPPGVKESADDPNGAISLPEAIEKQLGIRMELQKRPVQVLVIDHLEQTPTEN